MKISLVLGLASTAIALSGCGGKIVFSQQAKDDMFPVCIPETAYLVTTAGDCTRTLTPFVYAKQTLWVKFQPGWGTSQQAIAFNGCSMSSVNAQADNKGAETITAAANVLSAVSSTVKTAATGGAGALMKINDASTKDSKGNTSQTHDQKSGVSCTVSSKAVVLDELTRQFVTVPLPIPDVTPQMPH